MNITPAQVAVNRTARLVAEATTPVFVSTREGAAQRERERQLDWAEGFTSGTDEQPWCHLCSRATDHFGEHTDEQLLAFYNGKGRMFRR